jgi:hypothetical protein
MLVHVFAGVLRLEWDEAFELHVVSWIDLRHIVDGGDVTSFVFTFDAFVRDDVDVMKERFVVIFRKWGSAGRAWWIWDGGPGRGPATLAQGLEVPVAQEVQRLLVWRARMVRRFWKAKGIMVRMF